MYTVIENSGEIDRFLESFAPPSKHPIICAYLFIALRRPLEKESAFFEVTGDHTRRFNPALVDEASRETIRQTCLWIDDAIKQNKPWLERQDSTGRPERLQQISSLADAQYRIDKDAQRGNLKDAFSEAAVVLGRRQRLGHIDIVEKLDSGYIWIQLLTPSALADESALTGNCVGQVTTYSSFIKKPAAAIYSLRDAVGKSHMTVQVEHGTVLQCRGQGNAPPVGHHMAMVSAWIRKKQWSLGPDLAKVCLFHQEGRYYSLNEIPPAFVYEGDYILRNARWLKHMPKNFSATGNVTIDTADGFAKIVETIRAGKSLRIENCVFLEKISRHLSAKNDIVISQNPELRLITAKLEAQTDIDIHNCHELNFIGNNITAGRNIKISCCPQLLSVGNQIHAEQDFRISTCPQLQSIGNNVTVHGNMQISGCSDLRKVGENLHVGGNLIIDRCPKLRSLPASTTVKGTIFCDGRFYKTVEAFNDIREHGERTQHSARFPASYRFV